ncbi:MAG TPA: hypothetical protein VMC84_01605 [Methanocella sp.]|uniref:hypothetical protein n=1 Tax=Methanocella sp. TaxID=2052833 RepID=UPI002B808D9C|nr:hypothetical protein [Methanocella sp.]HTY89849.1 hypothetical protein [Methanocella sp.]
MYHRIFPAGIATVNIAGVDRLCMDLIVPLCYLLAIIAVAYFALEFVFTGLKARLFRAVKSLIRRLGRFIS